MGYTDLAAEPSGAVQELASGRASPPAQRSLYLDGATEPVFAVLHEPAAVNARDTAVLLCPPFGWEEVSSYRSRRWWAEQLAADGYATLRISYPGTGDSGGSPRDPDRLDAWTSAVTQAEKWLRSATGAERVAAIGIGLGGMLAYRAAATGAELDDLVLWATPARGKAFVRELRAIARLESVSAQEPDSPASAVREPDSPASAPEAAPARARTPGELETGGYLLGAETARELEALDLSRLELPPARKQRVLLLERDGLPVDKRLREALERAGAELTVAAGDGYGVMTSQPQLTIPPASVITTVSAWLGEGSAPRIPAGAVLPGLELPAGALGTAAVQTSDGELVLETPFTVTMPAGNLDAILVEPSGPREGDLCIVMLNCGAMRRIGPGRMWVEAARRWASRGVCAVRLDAEGIGEADGDESSYYATSRGLYTPERIQQVRATLDALQQRGVGDRFVLLGMCASTYWSFRAALQDPRVDAAWLLNPATLVWHANLGVERTAAQDVRALLSQKPSWTKIRSSFSVARLLGLVRWLLAAPARRVRALRSRRTGDETDALLEQWRASGKRALVLFGDNEPFDRELSSSGRMARLESWPTVTVRRIADGDHTFRPGSSQRQVHEELDRALEQELAAQPSGQLSASA